MKMRKAFLFCLIQVALMSYVTGAVSSSLSTSSSPLTSTAGQQATISTAMLQNVASPPPAQATQASTDASTASDRTYTMDLPTNILASTLSSRIEPRVLPVGARPTQPSNSCDQMKSVKPEKCGTLDCIKNIVLTNDALMTCQSKAAREEKPQEDFEILQTSETIKSAGLKAARMLAEAEPLASRSVLYTSDNIVMAAGFLDASDCNASDLKSTFLTLPMQGRSNVTIQLNARDIQGNRTLYVLARFKAEGRQVQGNKIQMAQEDVRESPLSELRVIEGKLISTKKQPNMEIISDILAFNMEPNPLRLREPMIVTLQHKLSDEQVKCAYWDPSLQLWSSDSIRINATEQTQTVCLSHHLGNFAILIKTYQEQSSLLDNKMIVTVASVLGSLSTVALVACIAVIVLVGYYNTDRMKIYINLDVALIVGHLVFFIGLSASDDVSLCSNIATVLHFCEVAALSWMFMEAVHIYDSLNNIFNLNNINPFFFYLAFGWGLPAAFAGACAGYPFGDPKSHEFCWLFVTGQDIWYFAAPTLILALMNIGIRVLIYIGVGSIYPGDPHREKVVYALQTAAILLPVFILTWVFGVVAVNDNTTKAFHYLFIVLHTLQGLLIFLFHCAKNKEIWQFYKAKKEEEERKANAVLQFTYVP